MKQLAYILLIGLLPFYTTAQNYVPNGDFEQYTSCPNFFRQITKAAGWDTITYVTSASYFNTCSSNALASAPYNYYGYQSPISGNAYIGIRAAMFPGGDTLRDMICRNINPLSKGVTYEVSLSVSAADHNHYYTNNIMVAFYDTLTHYTNNIWKMITPQISYEHLGVIKDTQNWVRLVGYFTADSAYDNLLIAGFKDSGTFNLDSNNYINTSNNDAYYYIDSVVVTPSKQLYFTGKYPELCTGDSFMIHYKTITAFANNNVFTVQLSNPNGDFSQAITIGSKTATSSDSIMCHIPSTLNSGGNYNLRIISSNQADTFVNFYQSLRVGNLDSTNISFSSNSPICKGDTIKLIALNNPTDIIYNWSGPNNFASSSFLPTILNASSSNDGLYTITSRYYGCIQYDSLNISISDTPSAPTLSANTPLCQYDSLFLHVNNSNSGITYSWNGPNNFNKSGASPYLSNTSTNASGNYILTATLDGCSKIDTIYIQVKPSPDSVTLSNNSPLCSGAPLFLSSDTSSGNVTYSWSGPNGFSANSTNTSIPFTSPNNSGWYIMIVNLNGCIYTDSTNVTINQVPTKPTINASTPVCLHDTLFLNASSTIGATYSWQGPGNYTSTDQNPTRINTSTSDAGIYTAFAILNGCVSSDTITVQVKLSPDSVNVSSNSPLCTGDTLQLISDTSTGSVSYTWKGPNSFSANTVNTDITNPTVNATGWYSMTVDRNGCTYADSTYVVVNQKPLQPTITYTNPICTGETLNLTASGSSNYSYQWYGPSSFSANAKNTTRSNAQTNHSGVYKVTAIENGCMSDTGFASITINPLPFAVITANPTDSICVGQLASFTALPGNAGSSPQYNWYVNTQLVASGITYNTTTLNDQDVVYCEMTDNTKCSVPYTDQSNFLTMTVLPWLAPSVTITVSPTGPVQSGTFLTFTATTTNAGNNPQYQWKRNGKDIVGATGSSWGALSLNNNDTITVEIISDYRCPQPTNAVSNKIVTQIEGVSINEIAGLTDLTLAPNPNRGQFVLSGQLNHQGMVHISVMNMLGQTIYRTDSEVINNQLHQEIALPQVASGMYLLQLEVNGQRMNRKFKVE